MPYDLTRFITAQENSYENAFRELKNGKKATHWMWYIFPQIKGLGKSGTAQHYGIENREEAVAYLNHELLSERLLTLTEILVNEVKGKTSEEIFDFPDCMKFKSCMTLFCTIVIENKEQFSSDRYTIFQQALEKYNFGKIDELTLNLLKKNS